MFSTKFISAGKQFSTYTEHVAAPYFRKSFEITENIKNAEITICGLGFYVLYVNGVNITKGYLAPYISNPDNILYYDTYNITDKLKKGKNTIGVLLGNGLLNCIGGGFWQYDKGRFRSSPKLAVSVEIELQNTDKMIIHADESFKTHPSPILFDDMRCGEIYDARCEIPHWNMPDFDDSSWESAKLCESPRGETKICTAEPIVVGKKIKPLSVRKGKISVLPTVNKGLPDMPLSESEMTGYIYDFGVNCAGNVTLKIRGTKGQKISMQFGEILSNDGGMDMSVMPTQPHALAQRVYYTLKGDETEEYTPTFSYQGFRYCMVSGITEEQATKELLVYNVMHSDLKKNGDFSCSDEIANKLQKATVVSDLSNFYYFPTDCPHREKIAWTADAALSAEQMLFNLTVENSYHVWLDNIRKSQNEIGALPCIIPSVEGSGFNWGNGPAWDSVIVWLPYYTWKYRGDISIVKENALAIVKYLNYLSTRRDERGLLHIGLGDWVPIGRDVPKAPLEVTDTLISMDLCIKSEKMLRAVNMELQANFVNEFYKDLRKSARMYLIESDCKTVMGNCQTSQAMGICYGLFDAGEKDAAFSVLLELLEKNNWKMDVGCLGIRILFHALAQFGYTDRAYKMIVDTEYPSYGHWVEKENATSLFEEFQEKDKIPTSKNHHFLGDISSWFLISVAGIKINPFDRDVNEIEVSPCFVNSLKHCTGYINIPAGKVEVRWEKTEDKIIILNIFVPDNAYGFIKLPNGYEEDKTGMSVIQLESGMYKIKNIIK